MHFAFIRQLLVQLQVFILRDEVVFIFLLSCPQELSQLILKFFVDGHVIVIKPQH